MVVFVPFANVPPEPVVGAVNVTLTPDAPKPFWSTTVAVRTLEKAEYGGVVWLLPDVTVMAVGTTAVPVPETAIV